MGERVRKMLVRASWKRSQYRRMKQADVVLSFVLADVSGSELREKAIKKCRDMSRDMEDIMFSVGGLDMLLPTLQISRDRPDIRDLDAVKILIQKDSPNTLLSKEQEDNKGVVDLLQEYLALFRCARGVGEKGGGRGTTEDQNIVDALMVAINGKSFSGK